MQSSQQALTKAQISLMRVHRFSADWLFQLHSKEVIRRWVYGLDYGYYHRACGGHANDPDYFSIGFSDQSKQDLLVTLSKLGIELYQIAKDDPRPLPGVSYTGEEWQKLKIGIDDFPEYEQSGSTSIAGVSCACWIYKGDITLSFLGNDYEVSESEFQDIKKIERLVSSEGLVSRVSRRQETQPGCISRGLYGDMLE